MPQHRKEPAIYSGKVFMMMGRDAGQALPTPYKVAQSLVSSGQARWEDDPAPMPRQLGAEIARREQEDAERRAKADAISAARRARREGQQVTSIDEALIGGVQPIQIAARDREGVPYLAHPFPKITEFAPEVLAAGDADYGVTRQEEKVVAVRLANASAIYDVVSEKDDFLLAELREAEMPDVQIPADWRERSHLANIPDAKKLYGLDRSVKMSKPDAEAILEAWTKEDDPIQEGDEGGEDGAPRSENGRILDGNHEGNGGQDEDGNQLTAEQIAERKAREFLDDDGA